MNGSPIPVPTLPDADPRLWRIEAAMLPPIGRPGFQAISQHVTLGQVVSAAVRMGLPLPPGADENPAPGYPLNTLLWRDGAGILRGVLTHSPRGMPPILPPNNAVVRVDPTYRRHGVGLRLVLEADRRGWPIDLSAQRYTRQGAALARRHLQERMRRSVP